MSEQRPVEEIAREIIHAPSPEGTIFLCPGCDRCSRAAFALRRERDTHCRDCCCARSWEALGITTHTGKSIPEEIKALRDEADRLREDADNWRKHAWDESPGEVVSADVSGAITLDDGLATYNPRRACEFYKDEADRLRAERDADFNARFADVLGEFGTVERLVDAHREAKMEARRLREVAREALALAQRAYQYPDQEITGWDEAKADLRRRAGLEEP